MKAVSWLALLFALVAAPACADDFVLHGHGEGGDGLGYGIQNGYISQRTRQYFATPQADTEPWGRWDDSVPGHRSHGKRFSHPFYGYTAPDRPIEYINPYRELPSEVHEYRRGRYWRRGWR